MTAFPHHCILDASVLIKCLVPEAETRRVRQLVRELLAEDDAVIHVPDLLFIECANILWKKVGRGEVDAQTARANLLDLQSMELQTTPLTELLLSALQVACDQRISAYDACYLALADRLGLPLVTADVRLVNQVANSRVPVVSLSAFLSDC
jgi:predicted nucleic acid-binding protein